MRTRVSFRDQEYSYRGLDDKPHQRGNGTPYHSSIGTWPKGPVVEAGGLIKIINDINVPAANINTLVDWTDGSFNDPLVIPGGGSYDLPAVTRLPLFYYKSALSSNGELSACSSFCLSSVYIFSGAFLTGGTLLGPSNAIVQFTVHCDGLNPLTPPINAWQSAPLDLTSTDFRVYGTPFDDTGSDDTSKAGYLNEDSDFQLFSLSVRCHSTSPVNMTAGKIRVVLFGFEF